MVIQFRAQRYNFFQIHQPHPNLLRVAKRMEISLLYHHLHCMASTIDIHDAQQINAFRQTAHIDFVGILDTKQL